MKFFVHRYELKPPIVPHPSSARSARRGALLRVQWPSGRTGFADVHPWPELGDETLETQLSLLRGLKLTPITEQAIFFAKRDAAARAENRALWLPGVQVRNNFLVNDAAKVALGTLDDIARQGFTTIKVKCGRDLEEEAKLVNRIAGRGDLFLRLDFNGAATKATYERFMGLVNRESDPRIEYVEDPFPYDHEAWREARGRWKLAIDYELSRSPWGKGERPMADVLILKPSRMDVDESARKAFDWDMGVTVTSAMDHAVGVMHAHVIAQELRKRNESLVRTAGCLTLATYAMDAFAAAVPVQGPFIGKPVGTGIGFDQLLEAVPWTPIEEI